MSGVQQIAVSADADDQRLDRWLKRVFPGLGQGQIEKMCRKGELRVDGARCKANTRVQQGQTVRVPPINVTPREERKPKPISDADRKMIQDAVIYRDADVIVINKPAGLAVQGGSNQSRHVDGLSVALVADGAPKPKLVHRIDKDTSGLLVLALNGQAAKSLAAQFKSRQMTKIYWAAVAGNPKPALGEIRYGLVKAAGHGPNQAGEKMICVHPRDIDDTPGAKHALSEYRVLESLGQRTSWVAMTPVTGRTHQLRAHMAEIGHPIIGDGKYGSNAQENLGDGWGAQLGGDISRKLHLHARHLKLKHPSNGATLSLIAPIPDHMQKTWAHFDWREGDVPNDPFEETDEWMP